MRRIARHERLLAVFYAILTYLSRRLVLLLAWVLRRRSVPSPRLVKLCHKRLLPALPPFTADVWLRAAPSVTMRCFQLGSEHHADILSEWLLLSGSWQPALSAWLCRTLRRGDAFIDVGANTGFFSLLAAALVQGEGGAVVAIEACPRTFRRLQVNLALNAALARCVRPLQVAAAEAKGSITLYQHRREPLYNTTVAGAGAGGIAANADVWAVLQASGAMARDTTAAASVAKLADDSACWRSTQVPKGALDELLGPAEMSRARVIKIDVEGGEWAVVRGMEHLLAVSTEVVRAQPPHPPCAPVRSPHPPCAFPHVSVAAQHFRRSLRRKSSSRSRPSGSRCSSRAPRNCSPTSERWDSTHT